MVTGDGDKVGTPLTSSEMVRGVSFTGSTKVGRIVNQAAAPTFKKVHLEMGGKNVIMIMDDANLELAVDGCLWGGFGTSGDGLDEKVQMGPSNSESQLKTVMSYVEIGKKEGATLACGGNRLESGA